MYLLKIFTDKQRKNEIKKFEVKDFLEFKRFSFFQTICEDLKLELDNTFIKALSWLSF